MKSKWKPPSEISWTEKRESAPDDIGKALLANPTRKQLEKAYSKRNALIERNQKGGAK